MEEVRISLLDSSIMMFKCPYCNNNFRFIAHIDNNFFNIYDDVVDEQKCIKRKCPKCKKFFKITDFYFKY